MDREQILRAMGMMIEIFGTAATELNRIKKIQQEKEAAEKADEAEEKIEEKMKENIVEDEANSSMESAEAKEEKKGEAAEKADEAEEEIEEKMKENVVEDEIEARREQPFCRVESEVKSKLEEASQNTVESSRRQAKFENHLKAEPDVNIEGTEVKEAKIPLRNKQAESSTKSVKKQKKNRMKIATLRGRKARKWHKMCLQETNRVSKLRKAVTRVVQPSPPRLKMKDLQRKRVRQDPWPPPPTMYKIKVKDGKDWIYKNNGKVKFNY